MCKAKYDTNSYALTPLGMILIISFFLFLLTKMPRVFKRIVSGKPPTSPCPLHCLPWASSSSSLDLWSSSIIRRLDLSIFAPLFSATVKTKKKVLRRSFAPSCHWSSDLPLRSSLSLITLLQNIFSSDAQARDDCFVAKTTGCASKGGCWSSTSLLPRLSRDHNDTASSPRRQCTCILFSASFFSFSSNHLISITDKRPLSFLSRQSCSSCR